MEFFQTLFDSFKREMHQEFADVKARLDRMEARQDRQGGPLQGGSRAMMRDRVDGTCRWPLSRARPPAGRP